MTDTITVASHAHTSLRITEPMPEEFKDQPGNAPALRTITLNGATHESAVAGAGITRGVDAGMFHAWLDAAKKNNDPLADLVSEVPADGEHVDPVSFGFEPGLEALANDADNVAKANEGSLVKGDRVTDTDMKPTTVIPDELHSVPPDQVPNDMTHPAKLD